MELWCDENQQILLANIVFVVVGDVVIIEWADKRKVIQAKTMSFSYIINDSSHYLWYVVDIIYVIRSACIFIIT